MVDPKQRIGRFWYFVFTIVLHGLIVGTSSTSNPFAVVILLVLCYMAICLAKNRLNDFGWSGWWQLVPFVNLVIMFVPGDAGANKYGDAP